MEILAEILLAVLQFIAELLLQIFIEALAEFGVNWVRDAVRRERPLHPLVAAIAYAALGALAGWGSLLLFPSLFITSGVMRVVSLLVTPLLAGASMAALGEWRRRRNEEPVLLARFTYGFLFAFVMAAVRYFGANG